MNAIKRFKLYRELSFYQTILVRYRAITQRIYELELKKNMNIFNKYEYNKLVLEKSTLEGRASHAEQKIAEIQALLNR